MIPLGDRVRRAAAAQRAREGRREDDAARRTRARLGGDDGAPPPREPSPREPSPREPSPREPPTTDDEEGGDDEADDPRRASLLRAAAEGDGGAFDPEALLEAWAADRGGGGGAVAANAPPPAAPPPPPPLLPYELARAFLEAHPVVRTQLLDPREVHAALLEVHARERAAAERARPQRPSSAGRAGADCPHCHRGRAVVDAREGCRVCDRCGAVLTLRPLVLHRDPVHREDEIEAAEREAAATRRRGGAVRHIRGVSDWIVRRANAAAATTRRADEGGVRHRIWEALEQPNRFTGHAAETVRAMAHALAAEEAGGAAPRRGLHVRAAARLLHPLVRDQIEAYAAGDALRARLSHNYWSTEAAVRESIAACLAAVPEEEGAGEEEGAPPPPHARASPRAPPRPSRRRARRRSTRSCATPSPRRPLRARAAARAGTPPRTRASTAACAPCTATPARDGVCVCMCVARVILLKGGLFHPRHPPPLPLTAAAAARPPRARRSRRGGPC